MRATTRNYTSISLIMEEYRAPTLAESNMVSSTIQQYCTLKYQSASLSKTVLDKPVCIQHNSLEYRLYPTLLLDADCNPQSIGYRWTVFGFITHKRPWFYHKQLNNYFEFRQQTSLLSLAISDQSCSNIIIMLCAFLFCLKIY